MFEFDKNRPKKANKKLHSYMKLWISGMNQCDVRWMRENI